LKENTMASSRSKTPSSAVYPIDTDCDFVDHYTKLGPPPTDSFAFPDDTDVLDSARDAAFLSRSYLLHSLGVPQAVDTLTERLLGGDLDLCDDALIDALECRRRRILLGEHPSPAAVASVAASALGVSSPGAQGVAPNQAVAALRRELQHTFIAIACGREHEQECAATRYLPLRRRYLGEFRFSLSDAGRLVIRKDAVARAGDDVILRSPTLRAAYGTSCGDDPLALALTILQRPRREQVLGQEQLALAQEFHRLVAFEPLPTVPQAYQVADFVAAYEGTCSGYPTHHPCLGATPTASMSGT
jgi:hypothetical protein